MGVAGMALCGCGRHPFKGYVRCEVHSRTGTRRVYATSAEWLEDYQAADAEPTEPPVSDWQPRVNGPVTTHRKESG